MRSIGALLQGRFGDGYGDLLGCLDPRPYLERALDGKHQRAPLGSRDLDDDAHGLLEETRGRGLHRDGLRGLDQRHFVERDSSARRP